MGGEEGGKKREEGRRAGRRERRRGGKERRLGRREESSRSSTAPAPSSLRHPPAASGVVCGCSLCSGPPLPEPRDKWSLVTPSKTLCPWGPNSSRQAQGRRGPHPAPSQSSCGPRWVPGWPSPPVLGGWGLPPHLQVFAGLCPPAERLFLPPTEHSPRLVSTAHLGSSWSPGLLYSTPSAWCRPHTHLGRNLSQVSLCPRCGPLGAVAAPVSFLECLWAQHGTQLGTCLLNEYMT